jgi:hypothetical protein
MTGPPAPAERRPRRPPGRPARCTRNGELLCLAAAQLSDEQLDRQLPVLIVSDDEVVVDEPRPLRSLIETIGRAHLPMHAKQLRDLKLSDPT